MTRLADVKVRDLAAEIVSTVDGEPPEPGSDNQHAVLITHDREFSKRRQRNVVGRHIFLECNEMDAADVLERHLALILPVLQRQNDVWVRVPPNAQPKLSYNWE